MTAQPPSAPKIPQSLGQHFWRLATEPGSFTELREPNAVVRHTIASIRSLLGEGLGGVASDPIGFVMGLHRNPRYSSPEQRRGGADTSQSLVYSIGVLMFERLTGYHPFADPRRAANDGARELCHVPAALREILRRALSPFPEDRHCDAAALRRSLETYLRRQTGERQRTASPAVPRSLANRAPDTVRAPNDIDEPLAAGSVSAAVAAPGAWIERTRATTAHNEPATAYYAREMMRATTEVDPVRPTHIPEPPASVRATDPTTIIHARRRRFDTFSLGLPPAGAGLALLRRLAPKVQSYGRLPAVGVAALVLVAATLTLAGAERVDSNSRQPDTDSPAPAAAPAPPPTSAALPEPQRTPKPAPAPTADAPAMPPSDAAALDPAPVDADEGSIEQVGPEEPPERAPGTFDLEAAGRLAALATTECVPAHRRRQVALAVTLRFSRDGVSDKVFFGPGQRMPRAQRRCLLSALRGIDAGGRPSAPRLVTYTLHFAGGEPGHRVASLR